MQWFPITDPARADDIRVRRRRALLLLGSVVFVPWMMWGDHHATRSPARIPVVMHAPSREPGAGIETRRIAADALRIDLPCADQVTVLPDPTLSGQAILSASGGTLDAMTISGGTISGTGSCADDSTVTIRTGNVMPLQLVQSGDNDMRVGRFDSAVSVDSRGSGTVTIDHAGTLVVHGDGSGDITVGSVTGPLTAIMHGSGDLRVDGGTIPVLDLEATHSADLLLDRAQALGGRARLGGSGDLHLGGISGSFEASTRGSGDISIDRVDNDRLALFGEGSGDIKIGAGRIATLDAIRRGSGDLSIVAGIGAGRLDHGGSGTVDVPNGAALVRSGR